MNDAERKIYMFLCIAGREAEALKYRESCEIHTCEVGGTNLGQPDNDCIDGMTNLEKIYEAHPDWPRHIRHGEDTGVLSGIQPLLDGEVAPLYRFPGGQCVGTDYKITAVRVSPMENEVGMICCGACGAELICDACGDMPDVCPVCHEGIDWLETF